VLYFPGAPGAAVTVHPNTFQSLLDTVPAGGWQVVQEADGSLTLFLSGAADEVEEVLVREVRRSLVTLGAMVPAVRLHRVTSIPRSAAGKAPLIRSNRDEAPFSVAAVEARTQER
jgi:phenylacetate-CoA ligase